MVEVKQAGRGSQAWLVPTGTLKGLMQALKMKHVDPFITHWRFTAGAFLADSAAAATEDRPDAALAYHGCRRPGGAVIVRPRRSDGTATRRAGLTAHAVSVLACAGTGSTG